MRDESRSFRRTLTVILSLLGLLTAGSVLLFGHLLFKSLSRDVVADALLHSRQEAERLARGVAERSAGDLYTLKYRQKEFDTFVGSALSERQVLNEVRVVDKTGKLVYAFQIGVTLPKRAETAPPEGGRIVPVRPGSALTPDQSVREVTIPIEDPYDIAVPIGDIGVLHVGVSRKELEARVEKLRGRLYARTFAAAIASLLGIGAASAAVIVLYARNRRMEVAHAEAVRRAELGEVAAGLAHEIRNPLNAMGLNLELLEEQLESGAAPASPAAADLARAARHETGRLSRLLTDFLAYARPTPIVAMPADLNDPAADAVAFLTPEAGQRGIRLDFSPHPGGASAKLDEARVKQVVLNLVGNALDAVEGLEPERRRVTVAVEDGGAAWRLTVADCGRGVPQGKQREVFGVFVSTKPAGTGLGLPIAERIVKAHGGTLTLSSREGEPTRAVATFPKG